MKSIVANGHGPKQAVHKADPPKVAAIYTRVSTTDQADKGYSLPTQIEACLAWADREGYVVPESYRYVDDFTGTSLNRPELKKLREALSARLVQAVIRLYRE
jgi:site-specific DNA recombinase